MSNTDLLADVPFPYMTDELPGVGGVIKRYDEDFQVDEVPLYEACGEGTHLYVRIQKQGLPTLAAIEQIARALGRKGHEIGYAGLKDAHGVTRQTVSIEHVDPERIAALALPRIEILSVERHTNKLKLGHLAGNRFIIKVRDCVPSPLERARAIIDVLVDRGVPNQFGPQRFGVRGDNASIGRSVLRGDYDEAVALMLGRATAADHGAMREARTLFDAGRLGEAAAAWPAKFGQQARVCRALVQADGDARRAWRAVNHTLRRLYLSSVQSELFNRVAAQRIGALNRVEPGDIAWKHRNGACFRVEDVQVDQQRCDAFEISPTGPLFGRKMMSPSGGAARMEAGVLESSGVSQEEFQANKAMKLDGARRPLRVPLTDAVIDDGQDEHGPYLRLAFGLPPGAYATNVTHEVSKSATRT